MGLCWWESGLELRQSTRDGKSKKAVLLQSEHLGRSTTVEVAGVDTSARGSWQQLVCVVPTCLVESVEGCWGGLMQTIVLQKQTRGEDQSPVQRLGQNRLLQQCTRWLLPGSVKGLDISKS